ncbi:MAG TPA: hypothetical protein VFD56_07385 [Chitinophagaceae bacterium]|nr:hypothetical protein [Chitinophagaceae bacterium]
MEVHHHAHTSRKKWTHYFWEFLMLFLAVFCGFMAENFREHQIEHRREKQYMVSMIADLENDTTNLVFGFPLKEARVDAIDSVFLFFENNPTVTAINGAMHRQLLRTNWDRLYRRNTTTIDQLKYAGGMRLIRKKNVADSIAAYDLQWIRAEFWKEAYVNQQEKQKTLISQVMEASDLIGAYRTNPDPLRMPKLSDSKTIRINRAFLNQFLNELTLQKIITTQDIRAYRTLQTSAENLIALIKKEYHLK